MNLKKTVFAAATVMALSFTGAALAQSGDRSAEDQAKAFAALCDTNKDGMVSKDEFMKVIEKHWMKHDKDNKGMIPVKSAEMLFKDLMVTRY